jgi:putative ATP-binding cassette transporter
MILYSFTERLIVILSQVRTFTAFSLQLFITVVTSVIDLVSFSLILYSIQPQLFATIIGYALFGTLVTIYIGSSLLPLNFDKLRREADLRYLLVRIRENAESIAFYGGEDVEGKEVASRLARVVENRRDINVAQRNLEFFTTCYQYLIQVVPVAVVAPQYFAGTIQLGVISQSVGAFNHILSDLTVIVNQFEQLSSFSAGIERLSSFFVAIRDVDPSRKDVDGLLALPKENVDDDADGSNEDKRVSGATIQLNFERPSPTSSGPSILLRTNKLSLVTPDRKRNLIDNLDLTVREGENLLIVGNSGSGKSSLLRAVAGLWTAGSGEITRVPDDDVYFLPQRPYCALGSLKDQLLYPSTESLNPDDYPPGHRLSRAHLLRESMSDLDLLNVLEKVDLKELPYRFGDGDPIKGLNTVLDWGNTLSLGEQQRLAFGRLVVNRPRLVILVS